MFKSKKEKVVLVKVNENGEEKRTRESNDWRECMYSKF